MWKDIRVNVRTGEITENSMKKEYDMLGGRGLIAQFLMSEVDPKADPLGADNKLVYCLGMFAGTPVSTAHRLNIGAKSPLTGGIKESNVGGMVGTFLSWHGIKMLAFEDLPADDSWKILHIAADGVISLKDASGYAGLNNYAVVEKAIAEYGKDIAIATIGKSGEYGYQNSGIAVSEHGAMHPSRLAARGGLGAVQGSKKIKAVIIEEAEKHFETEYKNRELFYEANKEFNAHLVAIAKVNPFTNVGTAVNVAATIGNGVIPVRNFSGEYFEKNAGIQPGVFMEKLAAGGGKNKVACQAGCIIRCSNIYNDKDGNHLTSGLEYETIGLCGSNLDIDDFDVIAEIDRFCDDFGIDTIETGATLGVCMDTGKIPWGDAEGVRSLLKEMEDATEFGRIMGGGTEVCGKHLGAERIPTVKGQAIAAYDPRNLKATGVTYAVTAMGADHTCGVTLSAPIDPTAKMAGVQVSRQMQLLSIAADHHMCLFTWLMGAASRFDLIDRLYQGLYGIDMPVADIMAASVRTLLTERAFNTGAGFTKEDDKLPDFFYTQPSTVTGATFDFSVDEMQSIFDFQ